MTFSSSRLRAFVFQLSSLATVSLATAALAQSPTTKPDVPARPGHALTFHDEFDGDKLDSTKWTHDTGNGFLAGDQWINGWGNDELQFYTARRENVRVENGVLRLRALRQPWEQCQFTSGKVTTRDIFSQAFGRFEFRAKLPTGAGLWPALWLLPKDNPYGPWAMSGEIDVAEFRGQNPTQSVHTLHYGGKWPANAHAGHDYTLPDGGRIDAFHVYALDWEPGVIRWYVDDRLAGESRKWWSNTPDAPPAGNAQPAANQTNPYPAPFDKPFYLLMNLAVGGRFPGPLNAETPFPAEMQVDYVRVYQKTTDAKEAPARP